MNETITREFRSLEAFKAFKEKRPSQWQKITLGQLHFLKKTQERCQSNYNLKITPLAMLLARSNQSHAFHIMSKKYIPSPSEVHQELNNFITKNLEWRWGDPVFPPEFPSEQGLLQIPLKQFGGVAQRIHTHLHRGLVCPGTAQKRFAISSTLESFLTRTPSDYMSIKKLGEDTLERFAKILNSYAILNQEKYPFFAGITSLTEARQKLSGSWKERNEILDSHILRFDLPFTVRLYLETWIQEGKSRGHALSRSAVTLRSLITRTKSSSLPKGHSSPQDKELARVITQDLGEYFNQALFRPDQYSVVQVENKKIIPKEAFLGIKITECGKLFNRWRHTVSKPSEATVLEVLKTKVTTSSRPPKQIGRKTVIQTMEYFISFGFQWGEFPLLNIGYYEKMQQ